VFNLLDAAVRKASDAETRGDNAAIIEWNVLSFELFANALDHHFDTVAHCVGYDHDEFVTADAATDVTLSSVRPQYF
jgi:hypothetical protein